MAIRPELPSWKEIRGRGMRRIRVKGTVGKRKKKKKKKKKERKEK